MSRQKEPIIILAGKTCSGFTLPQMLTHVRASISNGREARQQERDVARKEYEDFWLDEDVIK